MHKHLLPLKSFIQPPLLKRNVHICGRLFPRTAFPALNINPHSEMATQLITEVHNAALVALRPRVVVPAAAASLHPPPEEHEETGRQGVQVLPLPTVPEETLHAARRGVDLAQDVLVDRDGSVRTAGVGVAGRVEGGEILRDGQGIGVQGTLAAVQVVADAVA